MAPHIIKCQKSSIGDLYGLHLVPTTYQHSCNALAPECTSIDLHDFFIPNIRLTMCGYFGTVLTLLYDQEVVDELVDYLIGAFELPDDVKIFCLQQFLPEMRNATEHIELPSDEFFKLEGNLLSTGLKLIYAFLWQVNLIW